MMLLPKVTKSGEDQFEKPKIILGYNKGKSSIAISDQLKALI